MITSLYDPIENNNITIIENTVVEGTGPVVTFQSGESGMSVLRGFTITGGDTDANAGSYGGGIRCESGSSPRLEYLIISGNTAIFGGGISCINNSNPFIIHTSVNYNSANDYGGGAYFNRYLDHQ